MGVNLLSVARIQASVQNRATPSRPYSVHWTDNVDLKGWTTFIDLDIVGTWGGFLFGTKRTASGGFIAPTQAFSPVDTLVYDHIFFRMRYDKHPKNRNSTSFGKIQWTTTADAVFSDARSVIFPLVPDAGFKLYDVDMNQSRNWTGLVDKIRFFPCEDGAINDEFFLNFFEIGTVDIDFQLDNPDSGSSGRLIGGRALSSDITITEGINDRLRVNLDGYGFVEITLTPQTSSAAAIARDLSIQLSKIAIGGYMRALCSVDTATKKFIIESGTRAANSTVQIQFGPMSAAYTLGLTDIDGTFQGTTVVGTDPLPSFVPISDYQPTTFELLSFLDDSDDSVAFVLDSSLAVLEGGRRDYGTVTKNLTTEVVIEGRSLDLQSSKTSSGGSIGDSGLTFIDLNHPFIDDGKVSKIFFNGIPDPAGSSKWKIFRPARDGSLTLVAEGVLGKKNITENPNGGLVLTTTPGAFIEDVSAANIRVRRGDLLGVFNVGMHLGTGRTDKPDALYYQVDGDAVGTFSPAVPVGAGDGGIPVYATGEIFRRSTVLDFDFGKRVNIDTLVIRGEEANNDLEYNVSSATSANFSADVKGDHTICYTVDPIFNVRDCFDRPNVAFNIQALNDGVRFADNGISSFGSPGTAGVGGATVQGATYFYVNKDEEFLGTFDLVNTDPKSFGGERDPLGITAFFSSTTPRLDKPISKAVLYFKDPKNMRAWQIETALDQGNSGGNGSINGFQKVPEDSISAIAFDNKRVEKDSLIFTQKSTSTQNILLDNPVILDVIANNGVRNPQKGVDFQDTPSEIGGVNVAEQATYLNVQWTRFEWDFSPIRTTGFRWFSDYNLSTKISEFEVYASAPAFESLADNVQVLFSSDGETFASAEVNQSSTTSAEFQLGNSPRYMRVIFTPTQRLFAKNLSVNFEQDQILFGEEGRILGSTPVDEARVGSPSATTVIPIKNNTGKKADLTVDIPVDTSPTKEVLYASHLSSTEDVLAPEVGGPGRVNFDEDFVLVETENAAINAKAYGLKNIAVSDNLTTFTSNLLPNGGFETGDLTGWTITLLQSGTKIFQNPRVYDITAADTEGFDPSSFIQDGDFLFGFSIDERVPEQIGHFVPVVFTLSSDAVDLTSSASGIDLGSSEISLGLKYAASFTPQASGPKLRLLGSPTVSGLELAAGSVVSPEYGTNLLRERILGQSASATISALDSDTISITDLRVGLKPDTRFVRMEMEVVASGSRNAGSINTQKFFLDSVSLRLKSQNTAAVRWYKSWRLGQGDFTDSNYKNITDLVQTKGSHHWWQPFLLNSTTGVPIAGQSVGFSNAFAMDRSLGIQSFSRMTYGDPGVLGCKWSGERRLVGFRIGFCHNAGTAIIQAESYPRHWHVEVLRRASDLGVSPDLNNTAHFQVERIYQQTGPWTGAGLELLNEGSSAVVKSPNTIITTWLFDTPVTTEGFQIIFKLNCDRFESATFGSGSLIGATLAAFTAATTCPANGVGTSFSSQHGLGVTFVQPLETVGSVILPVDNVRSQVDISGTPATTTYAALDLRRIYALDTNSKVFELLVDSFNNSDWLSTSVSFSSTITDDPNAVAWGNSSANFVRWLRFSSAASEKFEDPLSLAAVDGTTSSPSVLSVIVVPQSIIRSARIYPTITVPSIHTVGFNATWENLGDVLTDNNNSTFTNYSDFPVIALDLGDTFLLKSTEDNFRPIHDVLAGTPTVLIDTVFWRKDVDGNFTYSTQSFRNVDDPRLVKFSPFGTLAPSTPVRWVALRGNSPLRIGTSLPRQYAIQSAGGKLFGSFWRPETSDPITDHPTWFRTKKSGLADVSTIQTKVGQTFDYVEGLDFGAKETTIGSPYFPFDGTFSLLQGDMWGIQVRDTQGFTIPELDFPHSIYRVFRDPLTGVLQSKTVAAFKILGYSEKMFPTSFKLQRLRSASLLIAGTSAANNSSNIAALQKENNWVDVPGASYADVDTFQDGLGYTAILDAPVSVVALRMVVTASEYPDDTTATQVNSVGGFSTFVDISGPQTRITELVFYENSLVESVLVGTIDIDHALLASFSASSSLATNPITNINDGDISTFWQSVNRREIITIELSSASPITVFEWEKDENLGRSSGLNSTNAPSDFTLKVVLSDLSTEIVISETGFIGNLYSKELLGAPVSTSKFIFEITKVQGELESASSVQISEIRLIEKFVQETPLIVLDKVIEGPVVNDVSTKITYAPNTDAVATVAIDGMDAGSDSLFSERDFFELNLKISDINLFNRDSGYIKLGNSSGVAYRWDFKNVPDLVTGWNTLRLQFQTAADRGLKAFQTGPNFSLDALEVSQVDFTTPDTEFTSAVDGNFSQRVIQAPGIRFFEISFRGTKSVPDTNLELLLNGFKFSRNKFDDVVHFGKGIYLNNSEALQLPIENVDIALGAVEFWLTPDWDLGGVVRSRGRVIPSIFRIVQPDTKFMNFFYRPGTGFVLLFFDGVRVHQFETDVELYPFNRFDVLPVSVVWDSAGGIQPVGTTVQIAINNQVIFGSKVSWDATRQGRGNFVVGGEFSQTLVANPFNSTALAFTTVPTLPAKHTASVWGVLENLRVYNYAKADFSDMQNFDVPRAGLISPNKLLEVSLNGVDFEKVGSAALPLVAPGILPNQTTNIYVRTDIPKGLTGGENRDASILVSWKTPRADCE